MKTTTKTVLLLSLCTIASSCAAVLCLSLKEKERAQQDALKILDLFLAMSTGQEAEADPAKSVERIRLHAESGIGYLASLARKKTREGALARSALTSLQRHIDELLDGVDQRK